MATADLESTLRAFFSTRRAFAAVYLFGSQARGTAGADSDVDIGLLYFEEPPKTLAGQPFDIEAELSGALGRPVQCVILNSAPPDLVHRVLRDGKIIAEHDRSRRIAFEVKSRNEYFDILPTLLQYRGLARA